MPEAETVYLTADEILAVHAEAVGGDATNAAKRLRVAEGLAAAVERPRHHAHYGGADMAAQAAILAHGIAEGQLFIDGNKRTALLAMTTFLRVNGQRLTATQEDRAQWILDLAGGGSVDRLAERVRGALAEL